MIEQKILATIINHPECRDVILAQRITPDAFVDAEAKKIFSYVYDLILKGKHFDITNVAVKFNFKAEDVMRIDRYANNITFDTDIEELKNKWVLRDIYTTTNQVFDEIIAEEKSGIEIAADQLNALNDIIEKGSTIKEKRLGEGYLQAIKEIEENKTKGGNIGLYTGFYKFDLVTGGYSAPDLTIIAARPSEGKSTIALNEAEYIASCQYPVLFISCEMKETQLWWKIFSKHIKAPVIDIKKGQIDTAKIPHKLYKLPLYVIDKGGITIDEIIATVKAYKKKFGIKIVFIDYLQRVKTVRNYASKNDEVGEITSRLKGLCMDTDLPIVALSQLSRDKHRTRYSLEDLRDSGNIEQDADNVKFIYRPFIHNQTSYNFKGLDTTYYEDDAIMSIGKWRLGALDEFELKFNGEHSVFYEENIVKEIEAPF